MTDSARVENALALAEHGFGLFPVWGVRDGKCRCPKRGDCTSPGKHPITPDGFKSSTTDADRIKTFLDSGNNYGVVPPDGVFVLDVDGPDVARFDRLAEDYGPLPDTFTVSTSNGKHIYLRWPANLPRPDHRMFGLVTRWGDGRGQGYVIGPGSEHVSGHVYTVENGLPPAVLPRVWADAAAVKPVEFTIGGGEAELPQKGGRHEWLRDRARNIAGVIRDPDSLFAAVWAENQRLDEPKTEEEVRQAIGDVLEKYAADPEPTFALNYNNGALRDIINGKTVELWMPEAYERRGEIVGELTIVVDGATVQRSTEPLSNAVKADRLADAMGRLVEGVHWPSVLTSFYLRRLEDYYARAPLAPIGVREPEFPEPSYTLYPLVFEAATTILFAREGTGKSTLAAAVAVSVATGKPVFEGWEVPQAKPVLVLDWEASQADWERVVWGIAQGAGVTMPPTVLYQRMAAPITKESRDIAALVSKHNIGLVVVDSAMMASPQSNGEAADSALALFHALRELGVSVLLIDHLNKQSSAGSDGARPYGSVYKPALARSTFELVAREAPTHEDVEFGVQHLTLKHNKVNLTAKQDDVYLAVQRVGGAIALVPDTLLNTKAVMHDKLLEKIDPPADFKTLRRRVNLSVDQTQRELDGRPCFYADVNGYWQHDAAKCEVEREDEE